MDIPYDLIELIYKFLFSERCEYLYNGIEQRINELQYMTNVEKKNICNKYKINFGGLLSGAYQYISISTKLIEFDDEKLSNCGGSIYFILRQNLSVEFRNRYYTVFSRIISIKYEYDVIKLKLSFRFGHMFIPMEVIIL